MLCGMRGLSETFWGILLAGMLFAGTNLFAQIEDASPLQLALGFEEAVTSAIAQCEKSVVSIARLTPPKDDPEVDFNLFQGPFGQQNLRNPNANNPMLFDFVPSRYGAGIVLSADGFLLTNYHVIDDYFTQEESEIRTTIPDRIIVWTHERRPYEARVVGADPRSDLAVLKINAESLSPMPLGDAKTLKKGSFVIALGNPYAIAREGSPSASWGIVSHLGRKLWHVGEQSFGNSVLTLHEFGTLIQTDAKLNLGTSGGALLNLHGKMIGLTSSLAALAGGERSAGFAIPVDQTFRRVVATLREGREVEYGFLGVSVRNLSSEQFQQGTQGVYVSEVMQGTSAEQMGVKENDVILSVNDVPLRQADDLMLQVGHLPVEAKVRLKVMRDGQVVPLKEIPLSKYPIRGIKVVTQPARRWRGMEIDYSTASDAMTRAVPNNNPIAQGSVYVRRVEPNSPAAQAGLRPGTFLTSVNGKTVTHPQDFWQAVNQANGEVRVKLFENAQTITIPAP
ncbi:Periplasmic serine endoprotease DegP [Planctomycetales bacterium 10988]|nr:Periplasmic serine endoprotease DegP [Planctomycetales bacterium 10988]